jgi:hypothetical protein
MLITTSLAAVFASALAGAVAPLSSSLPPMTISVAASSSVPRSLVSRALEETESIWRAAGLTFVWRREHDPADASPIAADPRLTSTVRVLFGSGQVADAGRRYDNATALGWIAFNEGAPASEIYLSYDNATVYMTNAREVVGPTNRMTIAEREILLARALGRALAHELGHYLLATKIHTSRGLMRAAHTAAEFFSYDHGAFAIDAAQCQAIAERLRQTTWIAMHDRW